MKHPKVIAAKHRILVVTDKVANIAWNKHLLTPLMTKEKVVVDKDQTNVHKGYIRVLHGPKGSKATSVFNQGHFQDIKGYAL